MTQQLIIHHSNSRQPLIKLRDIVLSIVCWALWASVLVSIVNGDGFHFSATYLSLLSMLMVAFILWSAVHYLWSPIRNKADTKPLSLKKLARHFNVQSELIGDLQHEKLVRIVLSSTGRVTQLSSQQQRWRPAQSALLEYPSE